MRLSHPYVFVVGIIALVLFFAMIGAFKLYRILSWPSVWRRVRGWKKVTARVESSRHVTVDDYLIVLRVPEGDERDGYREAATHARMRAIVKLPKEALDTIDVSSALPLRVSKLPEDLALDYEALLGDRAEAFARTAYLARGLGFWKRVP